jgi:hypothetical protein
VNFSDPFGLATYVNCRPAAIRGQRVVGHCAIRVEFGDGRIGIAELIPRRGINRFRFTHRGSREDRRYDAGSWVRVDVPDGMTEDEFDSSVWDCAGEQAAARAGNNYSFLSERNSNSFVRHTIGCAGGTVPEQAADQFTQGAPGLGGATDARAAQRAIERENFFRELDAKRALARP